MEVAALAEGEGRAHVWRRRGTGNQSGAGAGEPSCMGVEAAPKAGSEGGSEWGSGADFSHYLTLTRDAMAQAPTGSEGQKYQGLAHTLNFASNQEQSSFAISSITTQSCCLHGR